MRLHTVAQLFLPLGVFGLFEKENFLSLVSPVNSKKTGESEYIIAPDEQSLKQYLRTTLMHQPGAVILPE